MVIKGGKLILPEGIREGLALVVKEGRIAAIVPEGDVSGCDIDAGGLYISPGFIDLHVHGGGGHDFMDGTVAAFLGAARTHARHGTTTLTPTTLTCTDEELRQTFAVYRDALPRNTDGAAFAGLHLEGPYFSPAYAGAQDPAWLKCPHPAHYLPLLDEGKDLIVRMSVAPETEGALALGDELRRRGIVASIAHTAASLEECEAAVAHGYSLMTHFYCAMSSVVRRNAYRVAGAVEAGYLLDVDVEVIADGCHLPTSLLRLIHKVKGTEHICLCTDAMRAAGMPEGAYLLGSLRNGQRVIVEDGVAKLPDRSAFAGSVATADRLVRTMAAVPGVGLADAVRMMTANPARILGLQAHKGSLRAGMDADLVLFDEHINIYTTILTGKTIYERN